jgi:hypothetical protein
MKATSSGLTLRLLATLLLAAGFAAAQEPPSCDQPEHRQFDFWLGAWEVLTPDGQLAGHNTIEKILNGCALEESWRGAKGSIGKSLNMYFTRDGQWHQSWVDGAGGRLDLAGGLDGNGRMVLTGSMPGPKGGKIQHEISWQSVGDGTVKQHWRTSRDGGDSWHDVFVGIYRPAGASSTSTDGRD